MPTLELLGLAFGSFARGSLTSSLWIWTRERNVMAICQKVNRSVTQTGMVCFDTKMATRPSRHWRTLGEICWLRTHVPSRACYARLTYRETGDIRVASSLAAGMVLQYLAICITCLILAFFRSWMAVSLSLLFSLQPPPHLHPSCHPIPPLPSSSEHSETATLADRVLRFDCHCQSRRSTRGSLTTKSSIT
jgi:hypothetical protein